MKPFFSYYGSKYRLSQTGFYPEPTSDIVVELFAGSAAYSTYHNVKNVILVEINPDVAAIWQYLISASEQDILDLPTNLTSLEELNCLEYGAKNLINFWTSKAVPSLRTQLSTWYFKYQNNPCCHVWNEYVKDRIVSQLEGIRNWQILNIDYLDFYCYYQKDLPCNTTYFIDPPYSGKAGRLYPYNQINYGMLKQVVEGVSKDANNQVIACENEYLTINWADFSMSKNSRGMRNKKKELCYAN
jgi:site-specific DNA-adenine methylase